MYRPEENIVRAFDKYITKRETATGAAVSVSSLLFSNLLIISLIVLIIL